VGSRAASWPGGQAVARAVGGRWTGALAAAGVGPARERTIWTDERIVAALKDWAGANGDAPTQKQWEAAGGIPSATTVRRHFGSWADALDAAGFDTRSP
jgi:Homing endonuclease associated repeat